MQRQFMLNDQYNPPLIDFKGRYLYQYIEPSVLPNMYVDLTLERTDKILAINAKCADLIENHFYSYAEGQLLRYKFDIYHQMQISSLGAYATQHKLLNITPPIEISWKDASIDGPCHVFTDDQMIKLASDAAVHYRWCKTTSDNLVANAQACTTLEEINAIVFPEEPAPAQS
jgi:hypothetical protein